MEVLERCKYFLLGVWEFRSDLTLNAGDYEESYDSGRELAHKITFRVWDY